MFTSEYEDLGHMIVVKSYDSSLLSLLIIICILHHGVLRESSSTTKLRVVFNANCPTSTGLCFNDLQMIGPTVQDDLLSILLRFRHYKYVLTADVEKMYRQVVVHPYDKHLQQIVWRSDIKEPVKV